MALAIFVFGRRKRSTIRPTADVAAGDVVVQGDLVGVARTPIAANTPGSLAIEGVFDFPKATGAGSGIAVGTKVYWDATNKVATATASTQQVPGQDDQGRGRWRRHGARAADALRTEGGKHGGPTPKGLRLARGNAHPACFPHGDLQARCRCRSGFGHDRQNGLSRSTTASASARNTRPEIF